MIPFSVLSGSYFGVELLGHRVISLFIFGGMEI
jgi:hypothetical protein